MSLRKQIFITLIIGLLFQSNLLIYSQSPISVNIKKTHKGNITSNLPTLNENLCPIISHRSGFYYKGFGLYLISPDPSYIVYYTLDGSNPQTSTTGFKTSASVDHIYVHPESTDSRGKTPAFIVRASLYKEGYLPSAPVTRTFIFPEYVKKQSYPGYNWPMSNIKGQVIDYNMSVSVTQDERYKDLITEALLEIPSLCITTEMGNLFNRDMGIYVNAGRRGIEWERACNVELIYPDGQEGFSEDCGLRIRGGASRTGSNPKHSLRLFFREEYGNETLDYPLFGDEGADKFYKVDLRTEQNYSWNADNEHNDLNTFLRDIYSRDVQRAMGQPYTRSRYYHLYLNGMYWGIYQTQERSDAHYAETYFGGDNDDYDVIKVTAEVFPYVTELADGNINAWRTLYSFCERGFSSVEQVEGKDGNGNPIKGASVLLDVDNLIDYMVLIMYTGNFDAPVSSFYGNKMPNNFYAIYNHKDKNRGFVFLAHDSEHSMMFDPVYVGEGIYENRVNIADRTDWLKMELSEFNKFNPQWIHYKLSDIEEYRVRFSDRAYKWLSTGGLLSTDSVRKMLIARVNEIDTAIIAESARWGDAKQRRSRTKDDDWLPAVNDLTFTFTVLRTSRVIDQLKAYNLYPAIEAPLVLGTDSIPIYVSFYPFSSELSISLKNLNTSGTLYYTLDGSDPRQKLGVVNPVASSSDTSIILNIESTVVFKARIKDGNEWSALREIYFLKNDEDFSNLKVTEVHYHPKDIISGTDTTDGKDLEFIELKNIGSDYINISGIQIDSAVSFKAPANTLLAPNSFYVIASKPNKFYDYYGRYPSGNFQGNLSNAGEFVLLNDVTNSKILSFTYDDALPWPEEPDGSGHSMVSVELNPTGEPDIPEYWRPSQHTGGSPFYDDTIPALIGIEDLKMNVPLIIYPNPCKGLLNIKMEDIEGTGYVELYSHDGRIVYNQELHSNEFVIDFRRLGVSGGMYILRVRVDNRQGVEKVLYIP